MKPSLADRVARAVHHCFGHPLRVLHLRAGLWVTGRIPAYDEVPADGSPPEPDGGDPGPEPGRWLPWALHHAAAHPLLVLLPVVGEPLHTWTAERM